MMSPTQSLDSKHTSTRFVASLRIFMTFSLKAEPNYNKQFPLKVFISWQNGEITLSKSMYPYYHLNEKMTWKDRQKKRRAERDGEKSRERIKSLIILSLQQYKNNFFPHVPPFWLFH